MLYFSVLVLLFIKFIIFRLVYYNSEYSQGNTLCDNQMLCIVLFCCDFKIQLTPVLCNFDVI